MKEMKTHDFVDVNGLVILTLEQRAKNQIAFVGASSLVGKEIQLFVPTEGVDGGFAARAVVNGRIGVCTTESGIIAARRSIVALHNRGIANVVVLHGYLVSKIVF